ncbi:MAG: hypothetical protein EZS28_038319, partial [Streblomastix strix]
DEQDQMDIGGAGLFGDGASDDEGDQLNADKGKEKDQNQIEKISDIQINQSQKNLTEQEIQQQLQKEKMIKRRASQLLKDGMNIIVNEEYQQFEDEGFRKQDNATGQRGVFISEDAFDYDVRYERNKQVNEAQVSQEMINAQRHVLKFLRESEAWKIETDLAARVRMWHEGMKRVFEQEKKKGIFDIVEYCQYILGKIKLELEEKDRQRIEDMEQKAKENEKLNENKKKKGNLQIMETNDERNDSDDQNEEQMKDKDDNNEDEDEQQDNEDSTLDQIESDPYYFTLIKPVPFQNIMQSREKYEVARRFAGFVDLLNGGIVRVDFGEDKQKEMEQQRKKNNDSEYRIIEEGLIVGISGRKVKRFGDQMNNDNQEQEDNPQVKRRGKKKKGKR